MEGEHGFAFLPEVLLRSGSMFVILLVGLRLLGKRGVKQLSVFEMAVIIGLGSAAGDPMFYQEVGLVPAIVVFASIIILYRVTTYAVAKNDLVETLIEGQPKYIIEDGSFCLQKFNKNILGDDEFFTELRMQNVTHLGQLKLVILETNGELSVFFYEDKDVKAGLPILPHLYNDKQKVIPQNGSYACAYCGNVKLLTKGDTPQCKICEREKWVATQDDTRVT